MNVWLAVGVALALIYVWGVRTLRVRRLAALGRIERRADLLLRHLGIEDRAWPAPSARVMDLNAGGDRVDAMRMYRDENPGMGLREARLALEEQRFGGKGARGAEPIRIEKKLDALLREFGVSASTEITIPEDVRALVRAGRKLDAIRLLRETSEELGLAEARDLIERL